MSESNSISYAELAAAHRSELEAHSVRRDAELQRAAEIRDAAVTGYERVAAEAKARLAAELEDRAVNFAKHAAEVLAPIVANFTKQPDRESTRAIQVAITTLEAEKRHRLPAPLGDIRNELAHAFCQIFADRDPECLARLAQMNNWAEVVRGSGVSFANELALTVLRRGPADVANQQSALEKLEMAIGRVAAPSGGSVCANPESRWEIIRFGGTPEVIAEKLAEHDRQAFTARAGNSPDEIAARSRLFDEATRAGVHASRIAEWITARLSSAATAVVAAAAAVVGEPEAERPKRRTPSAGRQSLAEVRAGQAELQAETERMARLMPNEPIVVPQPAAFI